jgi:tRNA pseudouridine55 synthase
MTSRAVVNAIVRSAPGAKVGHSGTLDPLATGILVICMGAATRLVGALQGSSKSYGTVIHLGARSDTLDANGRIEHTPRPPVPSAEDIARVLPALSGPVLQQPPDYSALRIRGKRAYELARAGLPVNLAPRPVQIDRIAMLRYEWPHLELQVECGGGTYIRSIARDIGELLGCGGYVQSLIRRRVGQFTLEHAVSLDDLLAPGAIPRYLRPAAEAVPDLPRVVLNQLQVDEISFGRKLSTDVLDIQAAVTGEVALVTEDGSLVALAEFNPQERSLHPRKVFVVRSATEPA